MTTTSLFQKPSLPLNKKSAKLLGMELANQLAIDILIEHIPKATRKDAGQKIFNEAIRNQTTCLDAELRTLYGLRMLETISHRDLADAFTDRVDGLLG